MGTHEFDVRDILCLHWQSYRRTLVHVGVLGLFYEATAGSTEFLDFSTMGQKLGRRQYAYTATPTVPTDRRAPVHAGTLTT